MANEALARITDAAQQSLPTITLRLSEFAEKASAIRFDQPKMLYLFIPAILILVIPLRGQLTRRKKLFLASRAIILSLVLAAASQPYVFKDQQAIEKKTTIIVLSDASESMGIFPNARSIAGNAFTEIKQNTEKYTTESDVQLQYFGGGNRTDLWDALYKTVLGSTKERNVVVLVSDGVSNHGKDFASIARVITESNTTVYPILPGPSYADTMVASAYGAAKTPVDSDYELLVEVRKTGTDESRYDLKVSVDGKQYAREEVRQANDTDVIGFTLNFKKEGVRRVDVELAPAGNDFFEGNNRFTKIVEVVEKPRVLVISRDPKSPLGEILKALYNVTKTGSLSRDYSSYSAVVVDNFDAPALDANLEQLRDYITNGNGLIVVGGNNSYDRGDYNNSLIENLLPVRSREKPKEKRKPVTALFLIDVSGSGQYTGVSETTINLEKAMSVRLIKELDLNDSLGVIAFNVNAFPVSNIAPVEVGRDTAIDRILRLKAGGDTDMVQALEMAGDFLKEELNERVLVVFSDGIIRLTRIPTTVDAVKALKDKGVKVYLVGVGSDNVGLATLKYVADSSGSLFFEPQEYQRLKLAFNREGQEETGKVGLYVSDPHHFVTRNLKLSGTEIADYNNVREKLNAQVLVSTEGGSPIVSVWRFGLGRVASVATDDGFDWATSLYSGDAARLFPALTNWVVGDIEGRKNTVVQAEDIFLGEPTLVIARSDSPPKVTVTPSGGAGEDLPLKRVGLSLHSAEYSPLESGVYLVSAASSEGSDSTGFSVNYPKEYERSGVDLETLGKLARLSQGKIYTSGESMALTQDIVYDVKNRSEVKSQEKKPVTLYFLAAALSLYFADACARRINEILQLSR